MLFWAVLASGFTTCLGVSNARLHGSSTRADLLAQLGHVDRSLDRGGAERMQGLFPEGFVFTWALYGMAWAELGHGLAEGDPRRLKAAVEAARALDALESPAGRAPFSPDLAPPHGIFYAGWTSWLRGRWLTLLPEADRTGADQVRLERGCARIAAALDAADGPYLEAYPGQRWPVDTVVAVAALRQCDALLPPRHAARVARWQEAAMSRLDPATGLLPHRVGDGSADGEGARGSSMSLALHFLPTIDPAWSRTLYLAWREQFVFSRAGLPAVREYPVGTSGRGDVDSGPLLFGVSLSASAVGIGAARRHGDPVLAEGLERSAAFSGLPLTWQGRRFYMGGALPVGDAFIAWASAAPGPEEAVSVPASPVPSPGWRLRAHLASVMLAAAAWAPLWLPAALAVRRRRRG